MKIVILNLEDLSIASIYEADAPDQSEYGGPWGDATQTTHVTIPAGMDSRALEFAKVNNLIVVTENATLKAQLVQQDTISSIQHAIGAAMLFGQNLMTKFAAENVMLGITQDGKTGEVLNKMAPIISALQSGSLYEAITRAKAINPTTYDTKYITHARIYSFINEIEAYLGLQLSL